jgi:PIN domain nuclease of toxin-antitoxin system
LEDVVILLDTQVAFWSVVDPDRIGHTARTRMSSAACYVSAISLVEFRIKEMNGKLRLPPALASEFEGQGFGALAYRSEHADALLRFPSLAARDPFDRMLLGQAAADGLDFLTSDRTLLALGQPWIIDATK